MKKALIIASCGLILILIIGAASKQVTIPGHDFPEGFQDHKCIDAIDHKNPQPECVNKGIIPKDRHSEKFLRNIKRKARLLYA